MKKYPEIRIIGARINLYQAKTADSQFVSGRFICKIIYPKSRRIKPEINHFLLILRIINGCFAIVFFR